MSATRGSSKMDQKLVDVAMEYHGPELVNQLFEEGVEAQLPNFLALPPGKKREQPR